MMNNQTIHKWQPSKRMIALMDKNKGRTDLIIDPNTAIFKDVYKEKLRNKISTRAYMCFERECNGTGSYIANMTWGEFITNIYDDDKAFEFLCIRNFGAKTLAEVRNALKHD